MIIAEACNQNWPHVAYAVAWLALLGFISWLVFR